MATGLGCYLASAIRVVTLEGNPWFVVNDALPHLGFAHDVKGGFSNRLKCLDDDQIKTESLPTILAGGRAGPFRKQYIIAESALYTLIMRSDKPQAKVFQDWVTKEVLPSIRKTGSFVTGQPSLVENPQMSALVN